MQELALYGSAKKALAACVATDEAKHIRDLAMAQRAYAQQAKDKQMLCDAAEIVRRAEFRLHELTEAQRETVGLNKGALRRGVNEPPRDGRPTLAEAGIDKSLAKRVRQAGLIAALGSEAIEKEIERVRAEAARDRPSPAIKQVERDERERQLAAKQSALPDRKYGVIYADPEWRFEPWSRETGMDRAADNHYPTSETGEIAERDVKSLAADDCVLFLWATAPMLRDALIVMREWGFEYKTHIIWAKDRQGTGYWFRNAHELLLVGTRGEVPGPAPGTQWGSVVSAPVEAHSRKPEAFLELIESYFPNLSKIELNRRGKPRKGWAAWGYEVENLEA
jgi:N6-adenosine-specific RNA methylase IME4